MDSSERRRYRRSRVTFHAETVPVGRGGVKEFLTAHTSDVGPAGLRLKIKPSAGLTPGDAIVIHLEALEPDGRVGLRGEVRWIHPELDAKGLVEVGVELKEMDWNDWDEWMETLAQSDFDA